VFYVVSGSATNSVEITNLQTASIKVIRSPMVSSGI